MSLVLTVDWPTDAATVTVFDSAGRSIVADGRAFTDSPQISYNSSDAWRALCEATQTALDGLAALSLTTEDIRQIELTDVLPDELRMMFLDTAIETTNDLKQIGILSAKAAQDLGITTGCPVHRSTSAI